MENEWEIGKETANRAKWKEEEKKNVKEKSEDIEMNPGPKKSLFKPLITFRMYTILSALFWHNDTSTYKALSFSQSNDAVAISP